MSLFNIWFPVAKFIYSLPPPPPGGDNELKLLGLGLPRSGTDSLRHALMILGYETVDHGFEWWLRSPTSILYAQLSELQYSGNVPDAKTLRSEYFNKTFTGYDAQTDIPGSWFAHELLTAYPDAKVIVNYREDVPAWKKSFRGSVLPMLIGWEYWFASWFDPELFWLMYVTYRMHGKAVACRDFEAKSENAYREHYRKLEGALEESGREYLKWKVEDGWKPLCKFLGKPVPKEKFPEGNVAAEFGPRLGPIDKKRFVNARRNAARLVVGLLVPLIIILWTR